jgi:mRNA interferase MazF
MAGRHFALVLSPRKYNQFARLCVLLPITSKVKGYPFEVSLPADLVLGSQGGGGCVVADQIKSMSWTDRHVAFICAAPGGILPDAVARFRTLLSI